MMAKAVRGTKVKRVKMVPTIAGASAPRLYSSAMLVMAVPTAVPD